MGMGTRALGLIGGGASALALALFAAAPVAAQELVGQPTDGALGLQPAAAPLMVEKNMGIWEAMETSRKAITHCWFRYFGLALLSGLVMFGGALALGIGLIWTMPMAMLMFASVYHEMFGFEGDA